MNTLKKYWKEIVVIILLLSFIGYVIKDKIKTTDQEKIQNALQQLNDAQKSYLEILQEKQLKVEQEQKELEDLKSVMDNKIEKTTTNINIIKNEKDILKHRYKVGSPYSSTKLDSLLRIYSKNKNS